MSKIKSWQIMAIVAVMLAYTQPVLSQHFELDCEIDHYGKYSSGESRKIAETWFPPKSTHIISNRKSYHVEFGIVGTASQPKNRINFTYPLYTDDGGLLRPVKYTYLIKNNKLTGISHSSASYWDIQIFGKCSSRSLTKSQAEKYFR